MEDPLRSNSISWDKLILVPVGWDPCQTGDLRCGSEGVPQQGRLLESRPHGHRCFVLMWSSDQGMFIITWVYRALKFRDGLVLSVCQQSILQQGRLSASRPHGAEFCSHVLEVWHHMMFKGTQILNSNAVGAVCLLSSSTRALVSVEATLPSMFVRHWSRFIRQARNWLKDSFPQSSAHLGALVIEFQICGLEMWSNSSDIHKDKLDFNSGNGAIRKDADKRFCLS